MEELREELRRERREHEALRDIVLTSKLKAHMVRNGVPAGLSGRVKILRDADWAMRDEHVVELYNASVLFRFLFYYCYLRSHAAHEYIDPICSVFRSSDLLFL